MSPLLDGITYTGRPPTVRACGPATALRSTAARQPASPTNADRRGLEPRGQPFETSEAGAVLVGGELRGTDRRALHEVSEADAVMAQRVPRIAIDRHQLRGDGRGPEPIAGSGEADARIGGVETRVQPTDQQTHARSDDVWKRARPRDLRADFAFLRLARAHVGPIQMNPAPTRTASNSSSSQREK